MHRYTVDQQNKLVVVTFEGVLGDTDAIQYLTDMLTNTEYGAGWRTLIDMTRITGITTTYEGVRRLVAHSQAVIDRLRGARAAVLAHEGSAIYGMARMYQIMNEAAPYEVMVFDEKVLPDPKEPLFGAKNEFLRDLVAFQVRHGKTVRWF